MTEGQTYDLLIVGGGINGAGIARDAAGRGLKVLLCEQHDLAAHTSSASTKLIHGGLRYLEYYAFRLVREALAEREVLLRAAPHIICPLRFVLPHDRSLRPAWMIRLGLLVYDHLGGRQSLPGSRGIDLHAHPAGAPLDRSLRKAFVYSDCRVQDSRLVVLNALDAAERGAQILPRTACVSARRLPSLWQATLRSTRDGSEWPVQARCLVNATGPWVSRFLDENLHLPHARRTRLVKGSHIVVPRLFDHEYAYIFQNLDRRIVFAIPYEETFTLIGTTEVDYEGDPAQTVISSDEIDYLCMAINRYFSRKIAPEAVVWTYSGVRPLYDDATANVSAASRDYVLEFDPGDDGAPLLSVFGGKITTYRKLAEHALANLLPVLGITKPAWTATAPLPGGDMARADFNTFLAELQQSRLWLPAPLTRYYARQYGTRAEVMLGNAKDVGALGADIGDGMYEAELEYLIRYEWAQTPEDILWRRSRKGLHISDATAVRLADWFAIQRSSR